MSLFSTLQLAGNSLQAVSVGLQVVGQNIANANTPGYSLEVANLTPGPTQQLGSILEGSGVQVTSITEQVNNFVEQRLRGSNSDQSSTATQSSTYQQLESLMAELQGSGADLTTSADNFFSSIQNVLNQPESDSVRGLAVQSGQSLAANINNLASQVTQLQSGLNTQITAQAGQINQLVDQIQQLNLQIENYQGGASSGSDAVGLIDQRNVALTSLSQIVNINVQQQAGGGVAVYVGGDYLVWDGQEQQVAVSNSTNAQGQTVSQLVVANTNSPLQATSGQYVGLLNSRDQILGGFLDQLNSFSSTLATEFNKIYASGQGLTGYQQVTSQNGVSNPNVPLENAGLPTTPVNGSFQLLVNNSQTGLTTTNTINVELNGLGQDTTLSQVASQLNNISGISATISASGQLTISSQNSNQTFSFANDNSGLLTSLGINTFFTGNSAATLGVNADVVNDPSKFAASQGGVGQDTQNAVQLAALNDAPLADQNGNSLSGLQNQIVENVTEGSATAQAQASAATTFQAGLQSQNQAISGVNIDEETLQMITLQQSYQASAQLVSTLNTLLQVLTQL